MILVNCVWRQDDIIEAVESVRVYDKIIFKLVKVEGFRIYFDTSLDDMESIKMIKKAIKTIPGNEALFIDIVPVVNNNIFEGYNKLWYK